MLVSGSSLMTEQLDGDAGQMLAWRGVRAEESRRMGAETWLD